MPQLGETVIEGTILKWLKQEGDTVARTSRCSRSRRTRWTRRCPRRSRARSRRSWFLRARRSRSGTDLADDRDGGGEAVRRRGRLLRSRSRDGVAPTAPEARSVDEGVVESSTGGGAPPQADPGRGGPRSAVAEASTAQAPPATAGLARKILSPLVRRLAEENGVDLSQVAGTGTGGRITKNDVMAFVESGGAAPAAAASPAAAAAPGAAPAPAPAPAPSAVAGRRGGRTALAHPQGDRRAHEAVDWTTGAGVDHGRGGHGPRRARLRERAKDAFSERDGVRPHVPAVRDPRDGRRAPRVPAW